MLVLSLAGDETTNNKTLTIDYWKRDHVLDVVSSMERILNPLPAGGQSLCGEWMAPVCRFCIMVDEVFASPHSEVCGPAGW